MERNSWSYFLIKSIVLGVVVSLVLMVVIPELRQGSGLPLHLFDNNSTQPDRLSFNKAIHRAAPSVVNIYSRSIETRPLPFRRRAVERTGLGSGVVMTENGYILTCYHVIQNAEQIIIVLQDGRNLEAQQVGFDPYTDLAVLKINADNLQPIPQLENTESSIGDIVLAIGNPYNLGQTTTQGIISATGRGGLSNYLGNNSYADFIQMDAVLNEGNSGGALVDSNGNLVGINNANFKTLDRERRVKDVAGIFFAVPYKLARRVMDNIISHGRVIRGWLGISVEEIPTTRDVIVTAMDANGPAEKAGLARDDIIVSIDGQNIEGVRSALDLVAETDPGKVLNFEVIRNNQTITLPVTIEVLAD